MARRRLQTLVDLARRHPAAASGFMMVVMIAGMALLAPLIAPYDPDAIALDRRLLPPGPAHWAGTDEVGRDLLSRILWGARASLAVGLGIVTIASVLGTLIGCFSGYVGKTSDSLIMRLMDVVMALPGLVIAMALTAALGPSLVNAALALGLLAVPYYTRVARAQTLAIKQLNFVRASKVMGAGTWHQLRVNIIPNVLPHILVLMTMHVGAAILAAAALSFIGLGAQPPAAEWGALINAGRHYVLEQWWYSAFPGLVMAITVYGFNLLGDGLRDALDPKSKSRSIG
ncbi:MAG: D,D-dipeptide ABC transporter permease [Proteobacteria bacterium]|nr:MAG: D,D-dipeptide ABC transporter permease [Pseudomonadota bacterium]